MSEKKKVTVDGEEFEVEIEFEEGNWEISIDGKTYTVEVEGSSRNPTKKKRVVKSSGTSGSGIVASAIPGKIVAILASEGKMLRLEVL